MNKADLIVSVSEKSGLDKKSSEKAVLAVIDTIIEALKENDKVQLVGFGTFELRSRRERTGRDPRTGEEITIPASMAPAFKPSKIFKDSVAPTANK